MTRPRDARVMAAAAVLLHCLAIGVGAIVAMRSVIQSVRRARGRGARADRRRRRSSRPIAPWTPERTEPIGERLRRGAASARTETVEVATMVRPAERKAVARMVELRARQARIPVLRRLKLQGGQRIRTRCSRTAACWCGRNCSTQLELAVGDAILIGTQALPSAA